MYNNLYNYNTQANIEKINQQMQELEQMKQRLQNIPQQMPTNLTQNFQIAPTNREVIKYANSMEEVQRDMVIGDTPYFAKDMSVVWIKNTKGEIKTYELSEVVLKDEKDLKIEYLQAQINDMRKELENAKSNSVNDDESIESKKSTSISTSKSTNKK